VNISAPLRRTPTIPTERRHQGTFLDAGSSKVLRSSLYARCKMTFLLQLNDMNFGDQKMKVRATVICEKDRRILLVRKQKSKWVLPGGKVEIGEAVAGAAIRELREETGLNVEQLLYVFELEAGNTRHHVFEASILGAEDAMPQNEISECIWYSLNSIYDLDTSDATRSIIRSFLRRL
jgi:8-oxo-dGTP diphosphatase